MKEYTPKGAAVDRHAKLGRAEQYARENAERRARGEKVKSPSANKKRKKHGRSA